MKRLLWLLLLFAIAAAAQQDSPSLGDVARKYRAAKKQPGKELTNEDLSRGKPQPVPTPDTAASDTAGSEQPEAEAKENAEPAAESESKPESAKAAETPKVSEDPDKRDAAFHERYLAQKKQVDLLERELNVSQRESQLQTTEYYGDAGTMLRNGQQWFEKQKKYQDEIAAKQKALDEARQKLEDLKEEGRRAGASSSAFEK